MKKTVILITVFFVVEERTSNARPYGQFAFK